MTRGTTLLSSATVALALCLGGRAAAHPYLFFGTEDEPALTIRVQSGVPGAAYGSMAPSCWFSTHYDLSWGKCLEETAFRYRMSGELMPAQSAAWTLAQVVATAPSALAVSDYPYWSVPVAVAYDLIYDQLTDAERQATLTWLEEYGTELWAYLQAEPHPPLASREIAAYASLGITGLAIVRETSHPDVATWLDTSADQLAQVAFADAYNPGGSYDGGYGSSAYGAPLAIRFAEAYRRERGVDLLAGANIEQTPSWYVYGWLPHDSYLAYQGYHRDIATALSGEHLLLVGRANDSLGKWAWHQVHGSSGFYDLNGPLPISDRLSVALWYPDWVADITDPVVAGYPLDRLFPDTANPIDGLVGTAVGRGGLSVLRNGWSADSVALLFEVRDEWQAGSRNDSSSFLLSAYGTEMAKGPDQFAGSDHRDDHNVVLVGAHNDDGSPRTTYGGELRKMVTSQLAGYARADGRYPAGDHDEGDPDDLTDDVWTPVERADRTVALVRGPRPYVIVADDVSEDGTEPHTATWRMNLGTPGNVLSGSGPSYDPYRFEFITGAQLVVSTLEPEVPASSTVVVPSYGSQRVLSIVAPDAVSSRFLVLLQPLRSGAEEVPAMSRVATSGGVGAQLSWSDGSDLVLWRYQDDDLSYGGTFSDARLLIVRSDLAAAPWAWMAAEGTRAVVQGLPLLDTSGLEVSASCQAGSLEIEAEAEPAPRQIAAYGPLVTEARINDESVRFVRAGNYVFLPAPCEPTERCNGIDDDCDGVVDEDDAQDAPSWYRDADGDGYGDSSEALRACQLPEGYSAHGTDCDDDDDDVHPAAAEVCDDGVDNDCDGGVDSGDAQCGDQGLMVGTTGGCSCRFVASPVPFESARWATVLLALIACCGRRRRTGADERLS